MSLRTRLAITLVLIVTALLVTIGGATILLAQRSLLGALDRDLAQRADRTIQSLNRFGPGTRQRPTRPKRPGRLPGPTRLRDEDSPDDVRMLTQVQTADGQIIGNQDIPVTTDHPHKKPNRVPHFNTIQIDDRPFRLVTVQARGRTVRVAADLRVIDSGLKDLRRGVVLSCVGGALAAGLGGWFIARRLTQPLVDITAATSQLAQGTTVPDPIKHDRTDEVGQLANQFNDLLAALATSKAQQQRLVADASHELRTPLTTLRMNIDFLASTPDLPAQTRQEVVTSAATQLVALTELVNELVNLAAHDAQPEEPVRVDFAELVQSTAAQVHVSTGREITVQTTEQVIAGCPNMLSRAVSNLLHNAVKYSPDGTTVSIHQKGCQVEVRDSGPGFQEAELPFVFDRFFRSAAHQAIPGSGIGLAIVHQTATAHEGTVWAKNHPDGGASVGFSVAAPEK